MELCLAVVSELLFCYFQAEFFANVCKQSRPSSAKRANRTKGQPPTQAFQAFLGRDERRTSLKTPVWEANQGEGATAMIPGPVKLKATPAVERAAAREPKPTAVQCVAVCWRLFCSSRFFQNFFFNVAKSRQPKVVRQQLRIEFFRRCTWQHVQRGHI